MEEIFSPGGLLSGTLLDDAWSHINAEVASHFLDRFHSSAARMQGVWRTTHYKDKRWTFAVSLVCAMAP